MVRPVSRNCAVRVDRRTDRYGTPEQACGRGRTPPSLMRPVVRTAQSMTHGAASRLVCRTTRDHHIVMVVCDQSMEEWPEALDGRCSPERDIVHPANPRRAGRCGRRSWARRCRHRRLACFGPGMPATSVTDCAVPFDSTAVRCNTTRSPRAVRALRGVQSPSLALRGRCPTSMRGVLVAQPPATGMAQRSSEAPMPPVASQHVRRRHCNAPLPRPPVHVPCNHVVRRRDVMPVRDGIARCSRAIVTDVRIV